MVELTFVPTRRGISTHTGSYTHACSHIWTHAGLMWLQSTLAHLLVFMLMLAVCVVVPHILTNDKQCL